MFLSVSRRLPKDVGVSGSSDVVVWRNHRCQFRYGDGHMRKFFSNLTTVSSSPKANLTMLQIQYTGHSQLPWWALIIALVLAFCIFPFALTVYAVTGFSTDVQQLAQMLGAFPPLYHIDPLHV